MSVNGNGNVAALCEALEEIVAEMRRGFDQSWHGINREWAHGLADRIEAAAKRDEERALDHATRHAEAVARGNCRDCVHNPQGKNYERGNAAAVREALEAFCHPDKCNAYQAAHVALALPLRQCDVGTAEEQEHRFDRFCYEHRNTENCCADCPIYGNTQCEFAWAQMPYEEGCAE